MSERTIPTLEEIAAGEGHRFDRRTIEAELADVLIVHRRRLDALEVGRSGDGDGIDWKMTADEWQRRAKAAGRGRDEYRQACLDWQDSWHRVQAERDAARADAERLRPSFVALTAVRDADVLPRGENPLAQQVSDALLTPHGDGCRKRMYDPRSSPCTCGLADALKETPDAQ